MKKLYAYILLAATAVLTASSAYAAPLIQNPGLSPYTDTNDQIFAIIKYLLGAAFPLAAAGLVFGGFLYIASAGDEKRAERGKEIITYSIVGLIVVLLAFTITSTVEIILTAD